MPNRYRIDETYFGWTLRSETWKDENGKRRGWFECPECGETFSKVTSQVKLNPTCRACTNKRVAAEAEERREAERPVPFRNRPIIQQIAELRQGGMSDEDIGRRYWMTPIEVRVFARLTKEKTSDDERRDSESDRNPDPLE